MNTLPLTRPRPITSDLDLEVKYLKINLNE